jgi:hypothetical protein
MADDSTPSWVPSWVPQHGSLKFTATCLQVLILALAASFLLWHLFRGSTDTAVGILGNQAT